MILKYKPHLYILGHYQYTSTAFVIYIIVVLIQEEVRTIRCISALLSMDGSTHSTTAGVKFLSI